MYILNSLEQLVNSIVTDMLMYIVSFDART